MPRNKMTDLRNHMFAQLERLGDESLSKDKLKKEINRAKAISDISKNIIESAKTEIAYMKVKKNVTQTGFIEEDSEDEPYAFLK